MSRNITSGFGFQRTVINGCYNVWTCKISIKRYASAIPIIGGVDISFSKTYSKRGRETEKIVLKYATMDHAEHVRMQREIMLYLEEHAIAQTKQKYAWLHQEEKEFEMVMDVEDEPLPW